MSEDIILKNGMVIPKHELEISASRAGGPGGQHVNKANTKIIVRWNVHKSNALTDEQKQRIIEKLSSEITIDGDVLVQNASSRSQQHNKKEALTILAKKITNALHVPKKRMKTKMPKAAKEARLQKKKQHSELKKMRSKKIDY
jgi:ribosome-associated protein